MYQGYPISYITVISSSNAHLSTEKNSVSKVKFPSGAPFKRQTGQALLNHPYQWSLYSCVSPIVEVEQRFLTEPNLFPRCTEDRIKPGEAAAAVLIINIEELYCLTGIFQHQGSS